MTIFYYSILRLRLENSFHLCHSIIFRFLVLIVTSSHPVMVSLFFSQHNGFVSPATLLIVIFWVYSLPMSVTTQSDRCLHMNYFGEAIILLPYTPPWKPASVLVLCSGDNAAYVDWSCSDTAPLSPLLAAGVPPVKIRPGSLHDGAALIAPEDGNTLRALVRSRRWCPVVFLLGPLSIKACICRLPYVPNRVPLLRPMRDRGAVTMSLCRFFWYSWGLWGGAEGGIFHWVTLGLRYSGGNKLVLQVFLMVVCK